MTAVTGAHSTLLAPGIRKIFFDGYTALVPEYPTYMNIRTSKRNYEDDYEMAGIGTMPEKGQGVSTQYVDPTPGTTKRYTHVSFGLGFRATREMMDDDLYGPIKRMSGKIGVAGRHVREVRGASVLNNAFSTSYVGFKASTALCSSSHALLKGGTAANAPASAAQLSMAALEAALIAIGGWVDEDNIPIVMIPKRLLVPQALEFVASELVMSPQQPESANNAINPVSRKGISVEVLHYLTSTTAWFVQCDQHDINFIERTALEFQSGDDFDSGDAKFKGFQRFSYGYGDWRGIYGSAGA